MVFYNSYPNQNPDLKPDFSRNSGSNDQKEPGEARVAARNLYEEMSTLSSIPQHLKTLGVSRGCIYSATA